MLQGACKATEIAAKDCFPAFVAVRLIECSNAEPREAAAPAAAAGSDKRELRAARECLSDVEACGAATQWIATAAAPAAAAKRACFELFMVFGRRPERSTSSSSSSSNNNSSSNSREVKLPWTAQRCSIPEAWISEFICTSSRPLKSAVGVGVARWLPLGCSSDKQGIDSSNSSKGIGSSHISRADTEGPPCDVRTGAVCEEAALVHLWKAGGVEGPPTHTPVPRGTARDMGGVAAAEQSGSEREIERGPKETAAGSSGINSISSMFPPIDQAGKSLLIGPLHPEAAVRPAAESAMRCAAADKETNPAVETGRGTETEAETETGTQKVTSPVLVIYLSSLMQYPSLTPRMLLNAANVNTDRLERQVCLEAAAALLLICCWCNLLCYLLMREIEEALWRQPHRDDRGSRRGPRRMSGSRSRTSSWASSNDSSMGSTMSAAAAGYRRAAAAEPAMSSKRSSRNNRRETEYMMSEGKPYRTVNGGPSGPLGVPSSRADAPASPPPGGSSSKHKPEGRSRREGGATGGTGSKKSQHQQQQQRQGSRKSERKQHKDSNRDEITHFSWEPGMWLNDRYRVLAKLGDGTFGRVLKCADVKLQTHVAIKVVRDVARYTSAARIEAEILREVNRKDRRRESHCVSLLDAFMHHQRHMCLVFECLGKSLYDVLLENKYRGFYVADIIHVARQGLMALSFMRDCKLAHTDLKVGCSIVLYLSIISRDQFDRAAVHDKCMCIFFSKPRVCVPPYPHSGSEDDGSAPFLRPASMQVKIIDFGSATFEDDYHSSLINTRQYRAPEVILDIGWDMASDMWSLGCILMELYTGDVLFRTHEHLEHLAMIERIVEPFPREMLVKAQKGAGKGYVTVDGRGVARLRWPEAATSQSSIERVRNCVPLEELVLPHHRPLAEFVRYLLQTDPNKRPEPQEALRHSIFSAQLWER
ncbi:hypothetical protein Emag_002231 [Eimeria magna]